jgi:hypothetical protein
LRFERAAAAANQVDAPDDTSPPARCEKQPGSAMGACVEEPNPRTLAMQKVVGSSPIIRSSSSSSSSSSLTNGQLGQVLGPGNELGVPEIALVYVADGVVF